MGVQGFVEGYLQALQDFRNLRAGHARGQFGQGAEPALGESPLVGVTQAGADVVLG